MDDESGDDDRDGLRNERDESTQDCRTRLTKQIWKFFV